MLKVKNLKVISHQLGTCVGIISQPENRSVEELDQPDGTLSKRKSLTSRRLSPYCTLSKRKSLIRFEF
ncbi:MAG: hypothetical protein EWV80_12195 [Microcystis aeruginosa Ma_QC_B_20070730_S2]|uniref:Uncharacterized protein n=1 Tax=Microcystis aeruginosa Ma_QC_B_20070730_S2 TaxID=2486256 RepID=A0A552DNG6_MICAE|nr:MAG: hypothetical protein EWV80_12195 [Microcystis aeruginosa Ma_QC_B_20070730_S2]